MPASTAVARDDRRNPALSIAANTAPLWVRRWEPVSNYGYFELGRDTYRVTHQHSDAASQTWHVAKVMPDYSTAIPYTVTTPTLGSRFAASCDCKGWQFSKDAPRRCRHTDALAFALELLEAHDVDDDAVGVMERDALLGGD